LTDDDELRGNIFDPGPPPNPIREPQSFSGHDLLMDELIYKNIRRLAG